jgi:hypothetical protein
VAEFKPLAPRNRADVQQRHNPAIANWIYGRNGIPGMGIWMQRDPGKWGRGDGDPDGAIGTPIVPPPPGVLFDLDFSKKTNSFYFGIF